MIARPADSRGPESLVRTLLATAADLEAAETQIKQAILDAARGGDCGKVIDIVRRWQTLPSSEVLAGIPLIDANPPR